jgi:hypothetical protein
MEARSRREPAFGSRMFVGRVVVHDHINVQLCRHILLNLWQEIQVILIAVRLPKLRDHSGFRCVQRGKQGRRSVAPQLCVTPST